MNLKKEILDKYGEFCKKADELLEDGYLIEAVHKFQEALSILPEGNWDCEVYAFAGIGEAYQQLGNYEKALTAFLACLNTDERDNPYIIMNIGICFYNLGDIEEAKKFLYVAYNFGGEEVFEGQEEYLKIVDR